MIGTLPRSLEVDGVDFTIRTDYRVALLIFEAYNDPELDEAARHSACLECLYVDVPQNVEKALEKAIWFLDGGDMPKPKQSPQKVLDWEQDQYIIFPALNKVAGFNLRLAEYVHWWDVLGLFNEVGEGLFSQVMSIRSKRAKGKKLEKWEQEFYGSHKDIVDIKEKLSEAEQAEFEKENDFINSLI